MTTTLRSRCSTFLLIVLAAALAGSAPGREFHVGVRGDDTNDGSRAKMLRTISAAAERAQPGDVITVHAGVYRERIDPPRGGTSDDRRIVYQAAPGEKVVITGSEVVKGWTKVQNDTWKVAVPNDVFGDFNPYEDVIHGDWFNPKGRQHHTGAVYLDGHWLTEAANLDAVMQPAADKPLWFISAASAAEHAANSPPQGNQTTTIWAQFPGVDPNSRTVEINVRQSVFYPEKPGINYITVRGFTLEHAATPWAPPTAQQIGLIGTHWSRGWVIEENTIRYSTCVGVTLGKYGDQWDNTSANTAQGYVKTIERALANGWSKQQIGHHIVRKNHISDCEQAGIVGSLGAVFSTIEGNEIHDIHVRQLFTGAEQAGIKLHAAVDTEIRGNHIYRTTRGIWLDWMAQGTHVTRNLLHDNNTSEDLFVEVDHGPFLVDHNLLLSRRSLSDMSEGGAYAHNLFAGIIVQRPELGRLTPFLTPHATGVAGLRKTRGGDDRFFNNVFVAPAGLAAYDQAVLPVHMEGNVFVNGATPSRYERGALVQPDFEPGITITAEADGVYLEMRIDKTWGDAPPHQLVTTQRLGKAKTPDLPYEEPDGTAYRLDRDYFGHQRNVDDPLPGPFELPAGGKVRLKVWPVATP